MIAFLVAASCLIPELQTNAISFSASGGQHETPSRRQHRRVEESSRIVPLRIIPPVKYL